MTNRSGLPTDPTLEALEVKLGSLAAQWRGSDDPKFVEQYHAVYECLVALGWDDSIDIEDQLPTRLMPQHYVNRMRVASAGD
jgi:hypothetical protein